MTERRVIAHRRSLVVVYPRVEAPGKVALARSGGDPAGVLLTAAELRWLVHTGAPAALAALEQQEAIRS